MNNNLITYVISLGDDAMVLGQRLSEWCSRGPFMEEDLAMTNVALDYIGRASLFYQYAAELKADGSTEDSVAFQRSEREYSNLLINELPNGDFAFTLCRQYFVDVYNNLFLQSLTLSTDQRLAAIASKAIKETRYHLKRSQQWITQLALGTDESLARTRRAIEEIQDYVNELFLNSTSEQSLLDSGIAVDRTSIKDTWFEQVNSHFLTIGLEQIDNSRTIQGGRDGIHTEHLGHLLAEMQFLQRAYPNLNW